MLSKSPDSGTFMVNSTVNRAIRDGVSLEDPAISAVLEMYALIKANNDNMEKDPDWRKCNMEYDLRSTGWILEKVRGSDRYAQNLYAAICNNTFQKIDVWTILSGTSWSASWRHAGGIIADMRQKGDYIDWYCSGSKDNIENHEAVSEGTVTEEIEADLRMLGWAVPHDS